jgi:hypothetical protein
VTGVQTCALPILCRLSWNLGASTCWNPQGLSRPVMGLLYLYLYCCSVLRMIVRDCAPPHNVAGTSSDRHTTRRGTPEDTHCGGVPYNGAFFGVVNACSCAFHGTLSAEKREICFGCVKEAVWHVYMTTRCDQKGHPIFGGIIPHHAASSRIIPVVWFNASRN